MHYLTLEIVAGPGFEALPRRSHTFGIEGGRIGRTADNDWSIPYEFVHSHHARIRYFGGLFFIEKQGTNTVAVNSPQQDLATGAEFPVRDGDKVFIDDFELTAKIGKERPAPPPPKPAAPESDSLEGTAIRRFVPPPGLLDATDELDPKGDRRLDDFLSDRTPTPSVSRGRSAEIEQAPAWNDHVDLPRMTPGAAPAALPDDWYKTRVGSLPPAPAPAAAPAAPFPQAQPPPRPARPAPYPPSPPIPPPNYAAPVPAAVAPPRAAPSGAELGLLLAAFGVDARELAPGDLAVLGRALRNSLAGIVSALQVRAEVRNRFHISGTQTARTDSNPLKIAPNVEDAMHEFFRRRAAGTLPLDVAVGRALDELQCHQLAMLDAIESVFRLMLERFDPTAIEERAEHTGRRTLGSRGARLWEAYVEQFAALAANKDETFRKVFGADFARAYDRALERRRAAGRATRSDR